MGDIAEWVVKEKQAREGVSPDVHRITVAVSPEAHYLLEQLAAGLGMSKAAISGRLLGIAAHEAFDAYHDPEGTKITPASEVMVDPDLNEGFREWLNGRYGPGAAESQKAAS